MQALSETGQLMAETARKLFAAHCGPAILREKEGLWHAPLWHELEEAGLPGALEPEDGDLGIPIADALHILPIAGRHAAPVPLAETMLANWLLKMAGLPVPEGPLTLAP